MAFGFGFNKQKVLSAAEKFVQQGKLQNAIAEYEKILKADAKDLTVMNTVGDLYSRLGENDKAVECFKSVGDAYASQGFTVKAIAMYKKIAKSKPSVEGVLKLAELYTQQGLFNDARAQYLQVAEEFLRGGELDQAVRIFQKTLEMDPENLAMRLRLAEVYVRLNKKNEAREVYSAAIESLRAKGQLDAAEEVLQRLVKLDPGGDSQLLRARNAIEAGDFAGAVKILEHLSDLNNNTDAQRSLFQCYLQLGQLAEAGALASKLFPKESNTASISNYVDALLAAGQYDDVLALYHTYLERLLADDATRFLNSLHSMIGPLSDNTAALESIFDLLGKAGDKSHDAEILELLAHASVQAGDLERARDCYGQLMQLEPQNALHAQNYQQVMGRISSAGTGSLITAEEGVVLLDELEATAPFIDQDADDGVAPAIRAAITDAELYLSYNMPDKALAPLLSILPHAPRDLRLNQRLAALHTRGGRFADGAICCRTLESLYQDAGHSPIAERYGDLASKYEAHAVAGGAARAAVDAVAIPVDEVTPPAAGPEPIPELSVTVAAVPDLAPPAAPTADAAEFSVQAPVPEASEAIDLSGEWDGSHLEDAAPAPETMAEAGLAAEAASSNDLAVAETIEEIRFYLQTAMLEQARSAMVKLEQLTSDPAMLSALRAEIEAAAARTTPAAEAEFAVMDSGPTLAEDSADEIAVAAVEEMPVAEPPNAEPIAEAQIAAAAPAVTLAPETIPAPAAVSPAAVSPAPIVTPPSAPGVLNEIVADLETTLGQDFLPEVEVQPETPPRPTVTLAPPPSAQPVAATPAVAAQPATAAGALGEFVSDLESSLGENFLAPAAPATPASVQSAPVAAMSAAASASGPVSHPTPVVPAAPPQPAKASYDPAAGVDLANMFGELKHELEEETATADEDPETHYSLGVAFREMGLLDEAIGELQKVCQAVDRGHKFGSLMQTYTWLAQCFLDKGVPEAAIRWYESALKLPNLDTETVMALNYELASACEGAGDKPAALANFMKVYGTNIDYRDVSERIKALKS